MKNPYEGENTAQTIYETINHKLQQGISLKKCFYNLEM